MSSNINTTVKTALSATSDTTSVFQFRRRLTTFPSVRVMLAGTWVGTVTLQTSYPGADAWVDEPSGVFTANTAQVFEPGGDCDIRWVFTSRTSGTCIASVISNA
jgi:hypothetical protein